MHPPDPLRLCTTCEVRHYENCRTCWGFGVYDPTALPTPEFPDGWPVKAAEAHGDAPLRATVVPCPMCGSTDKGAPGV